MRQLWIAALFLLLLGAAAPAEDVRIGVLGLFHAKELVISPANGKALECSSGSSRWQIERPLRIVLRRRGTMAISQSEQLLKKPLHCEAPGGYADVTVAIPGKITRRYVGNVAVSALPSELQIVLAMDLDTAVASVVAAEIPGGAPMEALKAQAIASRSFITAGTGGHRDFDFCDTTHCQFLREPPPAGSATYLATSQTRGMVLAYEDKAFAAMYSASCGGRTHSLRELGIASGGYPYFSVVCDYCRRHPQKWTVNLREEDASALSGTERSRLSLARKLGWNMVPSNSYSSRREGGAVVLEGVGLGHGIGLCQRGAVDMARHGATFQQILAHYYPNTTLKQLP